MEHLDTRSIMVLQESVREIYADFDAASLSGTINQCALRLIPCCNVGHLKIRRENQQLVAEALSSLGTFVQWEAFNEHLHELPFVFLLSPEKLGTHPFRHEIKEFAGKLGNVRQPLVGTAFKISDVLTDSQFRRLALFNDFFRSNRIRYQMGALTCFENNHLTVLKANRDRKDFTEKERILWSLFVSNVIQAHKNAEVVSKLRNTWTQEGEMLLEGKAKDLHPETMKGIGITLREAEILHWISLGKTNAEISAISGISLSTVKTHLQHIYEKLGVENRVAAARFAMENGAGFDSADSANKRSTPYWRKLASSGAQRAR